MPGVPSGHSRRGAVHRDRNASGVSAHRRAAEGEPCGAEDHRRRLIWFSNRIVRITALLTFTRSFVPKYSAEPAPSEGGFLVALWLRSRAASVPAIPPPVHTDEDETPLPVRRVVDEVGFGWFWAWCRGIVLGASGPAPHWQPDLSSPTSATARRPEKSPGSPRRPFASSDDGNVMSPLTTPGARSGTIYTASSPFDCPPTPVGGDDIRGPTCPVLAAHELPATGTSMTADTTSMAQDLLFGDPDPGGPDPGQRGAPEW